MTTLPLDRYIERDSHDRPRIAGRRVTVADIAILHLRQGEAIEAIADNYDLTPAAVYAAMAFYYDHRNEIDQAIEAEGQSVAAFVAANPALVISHPR